MDKKNLKHFIFENTKEINKVIVDVPLFIRLLELSREDLKEDIQIHKLTQNILELLVKKDCLNSDDYDKLLKGVL